ncbi:DUF4835 family protein [Rhodohalobacter mucosus]|uniref:DUF4835 domain-containing protein n=1 Tax=Rhodohalobacter mucosus TaxID=2079485 RepID=A0A316TX90_9BACT|nr:DUF4835 family protein [Rhodohalobacter mucosus]PWN08069.1 DUF4835 domain-containing protein [Rhodohalobacter mucosus]
MPRVCILFVLTFGWTLAAQAQEFDCDVSVNNRQISGSAYDYVMELEPEIERYLNENRWSNDRFQEQERIQCSIQILLTGVDSQFNYSAEAILSIRRPIYDSNRFSTVMVISDNNWRFNYSRNRSLIRDDLLFDELTSFLDFYAYVLLGLDYDTFSELGGTQFYNSALNIFELGQNSGAFGWGRSIGSQRNRFGLINDLTGNAYGDFRRALYRYHRQGLDRFTADPSEAREEVIAALELIRDNKRTTTNNYLYDLFFGTKYTEIVAILMEADREVRNRALTLLQNVDPAHSSEYQRLQNP